jgi:uncharacterized protein (DUF58 family)
VGFAAGNTGNNLLYLLLGALLGAMAVSGWLSEQSLRKLEIRRTLPAGVPVGREFRMRYRVRKGKGRLTSFAVELSEPGLPGTAFIPRVGPGESAVATARQRFVRRGVYPLREITLSTDFPFGLFRKEREVPLPGEVVVWPRTDRAVPDAIAGGGDERPLAAGSRMARGAVRGEYRSLREYHPEDDARDIHWRTTARRGQPVVREYDRDAGKALWIVLDTSQPEGEAAEDAVEIAASLCARASLERTPFALAAGDAVVEGGTGQPHLERALDALARVDFGGSAGVSPAVPRDQAVLVTSGAGNGDFASILRPTLVGGRVTS